MTYYPTIVSFSEIGATHTVCVRFIPEPDSEAFIPVPGGGWQINPVRKYFATGEALSHISPAQLFPGGGPANGTLYQVNRSAIAASILPGGQSHPLQTAAENGAHEDRQIFAAILSALQII